MRRFPPHSSFCLLLIALGVVGAPAAGAQRALPAAIQRPAPPTRAEIFGGVVFSDEQRTQLHVLTVRTRARIHAIVSRQQPGTPLSPADRAALEGIAAEHRASMQQVLTAEQRTALAANERSWNARREKEQRMLDSTGGRP
jgi:Spy/CpxP family protein refolding chaperone